MKQYRTTYRAYKELLEKLRGEPFLKSLVRSYGTKEARKGDVFKGRISQREIDTDWLEAIEGGLRYIDQAIRENRRFIVTQEEIVPIERARKITSESVRHLAQHTSLISKVENGYVTPEKILNVEKEETVDVYENRFLRTLVIELIRFVDKIIEKIGKADDYIKYSVKLSRKFKSVGDRIDMKFEYEYEQLQPSAIEPNIAENVSEKSELERVFRVKKILTDFMGTQLIKALTGTEPVRPPIVQTNVMKQNVSFKKAYELYTFIMSYRKPGYKVVVNTDDGMFSKNTNGALTTMFYLTDFALAINSNEILERKLRRAYEAELQREEKIAAMKRQKEIDEWNDKIEEAVRKTRDEFEIKLEEAASELTRYKDLYEEYYANLTSTTVAYEELKKKYTVQETKFYDELEMVKSDYEAQIAELQRVSNETIAAGRQELAERTAQFERELTQERLYTAQKIEELNADKAEALKVQAEEHKRELAKMQELRSQELQKEKENWENRLAEADAAAKQAAEEKAASDREQLMRILNTRLYARGFSELITDEQLADFESLERVFAERRGEIEMKAAQDADLTATERERGRYEQRLKNFDSEYARIIAAYRDRLAALGDTTEIKGIEGYKLAAGSPFAVKRVKSQPDRRYEKQDKEIARAMRKYIMETRPFVRDTEPEGLLLLVDDDGGITEKDFSLYETHFVPGVITEENADEFFRALSDAVKTEKLVIYVGSSGKIRPNCDIVYKFGSELRLKNLTVLNTENLICGVSILLGKLNALLGAGVSLADAFALFDEMKKSVVSVWLAGEHTGDVEARVRTVKYNGYANSCDAVIEMKNGVPEITGMIRGEFSERVKDLIGQLSARFAVKATSSVCLWTAGLDVEEIAVIKHILAFDYGFRNIRIVEDSSSATARLLGKGSFGITYLAGEREVDKFIRHAEKRPAKAEASDAVTVYADAALLPENYAGQIKPVLPFDGGFANLNAFRKTIKDNIKNGGSAVVLAPENLAEEYRRVAGIIMRTFECSVEILPTVRFMGSDAAVLRYAESAVTNGEDVEARLREAVGVSTVAVVANKPNRQTREELAARQKFQYTGGTVLTGAVDGKKKYRKFKDFDADTVALALGTLLTGIQNCTFVLTGSRFDGDAAKRIITELQNLDGNNEVMQVDLADMPDLGKNVAALHIIRGIE